MNVNSKYNYKFEIDLIDFNQKRLGLVHAPRSQSTEWDPDSTFTGFGKALLKLRKSFIPKFKRNKS